MMLTQSRLTHGLDFGEQYNAFLVAALRQDRCSANALLLEALDA